MNLIINLVLLITAYLFMEFVAWSNHKYVMHGFLWVWHKDHHIIDQKKARLEDLEFSGLEKNDLFFLVYAIPAIILIICGLAFSIFSMVYIGAGITLYGFTYFMIHDVMIHRRLNLPFLWNHQNRFFRSVVRAHLAHHRPKNKKDFDNFGLLVFPKRYYKE